MKIKPYKEYKDIDLGWLDKIPSHWEIKRGKTIYKKVERPVREEDEVVTCFRDGEVTLRKNRRLDGFTESIKEIGYQGIRKGDLVIHQMDVFAGATGVSDSDGKSTPVYSVCNGIIGLNNNYYAFIIREIARNGYIKSLSRGIRERSTDFRFSTFGKEFFPYPPKEEQDKIVTFIKNKLDKINKFMDLKTRQIELLKEQKESMIKKAVIKGLNQNISMKILQPTDHDGFALLKCGYCGEYFKLKPSDIESDQVIYIWCPSCGLINDDYITDEVFKLALDMIENKAVELMYSEFKKMTKRYNTKHLSFKVGEKPKEKPETQIMTRIDELEIQKYKCCNIEAKIKPLIKYTMTYCPACGVNYYEYK